MDEMINRLPDVKPILTGSQEPKIFIGGNEKDAAYAAFQASKMRNTILLIDPGYPGWGRGAHLLCKSMPAIMTARQHSKHLSIHDPKVLHPEKSHKECLKEFDENFFKLEKRRQEDFEEQEYQRKYGEINPDSGLPERIHKKLQLHMEQFCSRMTPRQKKRYMKKKFNIELED